MNKMNNATMGRWLWAAALSLGLNACGGGSSEQINPQLNSDVSGGSSDAGSGSGNGAGSGSDNVPPPSERCESPAPREVVSSEIIITSPGNPNAFDERERADAAANGWPQNDDTIFYATVMLPERCPEDRFPVIVESHGYSGSRERELDDDGEVESSDPHFPSVDEVAISAPYQGYILVSFDERGHGDSLPENGGGYARVIDPPAETVDAIALLDWLHGQADDYQILTEDSTGIDRDFRVGLIGYSYGGGFQFPLAALDERVDTIVPNGTWNYLMYSLLPGDAVKLGFDGLLCLLADTGGVVNTPLVAELCSLLGSTSLEAANIRTRADLIAAMQANDATVQEQEVVDLFSHGARAFELDSGFELRPVPTLLLQGNRDVIFNMTESYQNWRYYREAAAGSNIPVKILTTEGAHMNPLADQVEGPANCGGLLGVNLIRAWFDKHLKGIDSDDYNSIPDVCISVADTAEAHNAEPAGLVLADFPVGSQTGSGGVPARLEELSGTVETTTAPEGVFVPVVTITGDNKVLAGIPAIDRLTVTDTDDGGLNDVTAVAYVGTGILRNAGDALNETLILVDDQVTAFVEGDHVNNRNVENDRVLLPGVGEQLQDGDQVGLILYQRHVQYSAILSTENLSGVDGIAGFLLGAELPPLVSAADPVLDTVGGVAQSPNPYQFSAIGVEMPIVDLASHPSAAINQPGGSDQ